MDEKIARKPWDISMEMSPNDWSRLAFWLGETRLQMYLYVEEQTQTGEPIDPKKMVELQDFSEYLPEDDIIVEYWDAMAEHEAGGH
jgi:hypothetical protein